MKVLYSTSENDIARVHVGEFDDKSKIEFVESLQPPYKREEKWVLIISTLKGCPVNCLMCDAGGEYRGKLTDDEMIDQIDYMIRLHYPDKNIPTKKFKVQFARMGDPAFNKNVLNVLEKLPNLYKMKNLMPCISTIAPLGCENFFEELIKIKDMLYRYGNFQMQFSIHTTDENLRRELIPAKIWNFSQIAEYGNRFFNNGDRKITLNFATPRGYPLRSKTLLEFFDPKKYIIKLTPINPTYKSQKFSLCSSIRTENMETTNAVIDELHDCRYETILSIGELEENKIGSNCGMFIQRYNYEQNIIMA